MSKSISGKEALIALANGEDVEYYKHEWMDVNRLSVRDLTSSDNMYKFRLKPRTITINGVELNQCYSVAIDFTKNEVKVEFKNRNDAEALHDVISKLYGFK